MGADPGPTPLEILGSGDMGSFGVIQAAVPLGTRKVALQTLVRDVKTVRKHFFFSFVHDEINQVFSI